MIEPRDAHKAVALLRCREGQHKFAKSNFGSYYGDSGEWEETCKHCGQVDSVGYDKADSSRRMKRPGKYTLLEENGL